MIENSIIENENDNNNNNERYLYFYLNQRYSSVMEYYFSKYFFLKLIVISFILIIYNLAFKYSKIINEMNISDDSVDSDDLSNPRNRAINEFKTKGKITFNNYFDYFNSKSLYNHIHIAMGFDEKYAMLSLVSITSILYTANNNTFLHFHIITLFNFSLDMMEKINSLKYKINNKVEFIFYDGKQVEKDFTRGNKELRGIANYCRFLIPEIIFDTNRVIMLDSGDLLAQKDLLELYNYNIGDAYIAGVLDMVAGTPDGYRYFKNEKYINVGVAIINNLDVWRKEKIYEKIVKYSNETKRKLELPIQDILNTIIPKDKVFLLPLKYNTIQFFINKRKYKTRNTPWVRKFMGKQNYSKFKFSEFEIFEADNDPVIRHFWNFKFFRYRTRKDKTKTQWKKYAKMTGFFRMICKMFKYSCI